MELPRTNHEASLLVIETLLGWVSRADNLVAAHKESSSGPDAPRYVILPDVLLSDGRVPDDVPFAHSSTMIGLTRFVITRSPG